jgi:hypothetical protein
MLKIIACVDGDGEIGGVQDLGEAIRQLGATHPACKCDDFHI